MYIYKHEQKILYNSYDIKRSNYLQNNIDEIIIVVSNKKSAEVWKVVNNVSGSIQ